MGEFLVVRQSFLVQNTLYVIKTIFIFIERISKHWRLNLMFRLSLCCTISKVIHKLVFIHSQVTIINFSYPVFLLLALCFSCSQRYLYYLTFQSFDLERTRRRLFQKHAVCTKLNIYVYSIMFMDSSILLDFVVLLHILLHLIWWTFTILIDSSDTTRLI